MKKLLKSTIYSTLALLCIPFLGASIFAQTTDFTVEVISVGTPTVDSEPEFTKGLKNTITWSDADYAVDFYAEISTDAGFGVIVDNSGWITEQTFTFNNLDDDTKYYYRVRARNELGGIGLWSPAVFSTQDNNAPTSQALPLDEITYSSGFDIEVEYFDETSGVDTITLFYRRNGGAWQVHSTFSAASSVFFNSLGRGGDGLYEFYTAAIDNVGNAENEAAHVDAFTTVDSTAPPKPTPTPTPTPTPIPPVENFLFISYVGGVYSKDKEEVDIITLNPTISGYSTPLKKIDWELEDSNGNLVESNYTRSNEDGYWEVKLDGLTYKKYKFSASMLADGTEYSDSIYFNVKKQKVLTLSGYAFPYAKVYAFYNGYMQELDAADEDGFFLLALGIPEDFAGKINLRAYKDEYISMYQIEYLDQESIENIIFPPILLPATQRIALDKRATLYGFSAANARIKIYLDGKFIEEVESDDKGEFVYKTPRFREPIQHYAYATQTVNDTESGLSTIAMINVARIQIPYIFKVGSLVERHFGRLSVLTGLFTDILLLISVPLTITAMLLIASATTPSGFYALMHDYLSFFAFARKKKALKIQVYGLKIENKEGILNIFDRETGDLSVSAFTNSPGIAYTDAIDGTFDVEFISTQNRSFVRSIVDRNRIEMAYFDKSVKFDGKNRSMNIKFPLEKEIHEYPFEQFERRFDRLVSFINIPITALLIVISALHFYLNTGYGALFSVLAGVILLFTNILLVSYRRRGVFMDRIRIHFTEVS